MNQIFGYQKLSSDESLNNITFEKANPVLLTDNNNYSFGQLNIFSQPNTNIQSCYSQKYQAYSYVWGIPVHSNIPTADIPEWCAKNVIENQYDRFKDLIGTFVIIIDEPARKRFTFVTDILGIRPMFLGRNKGRLVFGSNVWAIQKAGLSNGKIDYDSVSSWIAYGYNCTDGTLFSDLRRLPPGSVTVYQNNQISEISYTNFKPTKTSPNINKVIEDINDIMSATVNTLLDHNDLISFSLSGGFDSRYLLALILSHGKTPFECATVNHLKEDSLMAYKVAETLGVTLKQYPEKGSSMDLYEQIYHFTPDGFPIFKFVIYYLAMKYPELPMMNGYIGEIIRGFGEKIFGKYETEWNSDLAEILQQRHLSTNFRIFRKDIAKNIQRRSLLPMQKAVQLSANIGKIFAWTNLYHRQRFYISNNFLQHLGITEALLPFYNWTLIAYIMEHKASLFTRDTYDGIFKKYFPKIATIPHASDIIAKKYHIFSVSKYTRKWAIELLPKIVDSQSLSLLHKNWGIIYDLAGAANMRYAESTIFLLKRLYLLEKSLKDTGIDFDWDYI